MGLAIFFRWGEEVAMATVEVWTKRFMLRPVARCRGGCQPGLMAKALTINPGNDQIPMANDQWGMSLEEYHLRVRSVRPPSLVIR